MNLKEQTLLAKKAAKEIRNLSIETRNNILNAFADNLIRNQENIISENNADLEAASSLSDAMKDRLRLTSERIKGIAEGVRQVVALDDPLNRTLEERTIRSGVRLKKVTVPIGVIGIIFESRPNVSADCTALCFKSGNACILKGGKESYRSCKAIVDEMKSALRQYGVSEDAVMLAEKPTHEETAAFMADTDSVDLLIPRGGKKLIRAVVEHAMVPVIETGAGVCHTFVDASAGIDMAVGIAINAKCSRPSVCNAMETLLVHEDIASSFIPAVYEQLKKYNVEIVADRNVKKYIPDAKDADEESWYTEYNALILNMKIVRDVNEAVAHITEHGTRHSECIVSETDENVLSFMNNIDAACVYHNASTRFTDGFEFGLGAEIGISTQKIGARGPMGLNELTTYTYHLEGNGEVR